MAEFVMPSLGADMEAGTLVAWLKQPGDPVKRGDIIAEVDTDKGVIEVEVFSTGVLERLLVPPGTKVPVGTPLAIIREDGAPTAEPAAAIEESRPIKATPAARKLAEELGVDLAKTRGSAADGVISREDVLATEGAEPRQRLRRAIALAMERSNREIPHFYVAHTFDVTPAQAFLERENRARSVDERLLFGVLLVKAVALALRQFPELNGRWEDQHAVALPGIHVGMAISLRGGGVVIPAIHDADRLALDTLMRLLRDVVARARAGELRSSELSDGTITLTSLGDRGVDAVWGVIYPPQVALVGFGRVAERPWVVGSSVAVRSTLTATLAADHRVSDGHRGALFLAALEKLMAEPEQLR